MTFLSFSCLILLTQTSGEMPTDEVTADIRVLLLIQRECVQAFTIH